VLRDAVGQQSLSDARDVAAVVDARIRQRIRGLVPHSARPWFGAGAADGGQTWEQETADKRRLAADAELRRRHPGQRSTPLRSAEPEPASQTQRGAFILTAGENIPPLDPWIHKLAAAGQPSQNS
jgi:hypothetical protein